MRVGLTINAGRRMTMPGCRTSLFVVALLAAGMLAAPAGAQSPPGNVALGQRLAQQHCSQCHVITRGGPGGWTDAPSFADIADRPTTTAAWLMGVISKPHAKMLYLPRNQAEAAALAAYILSQRQQ